MDKLMLKSNPQLSSLLFMWVIVLACDTLSLSFSLFPGSVSWMAPEILQTTAQYPTLSRN